MKFVIRNIKESDTSVINHLTRGVDFMQIDFDLSRICFSKTGEMIGFVLLEKKPVSDFFGGEIPLQWNTYKDIRSDLIKKTDGLFKDLQFKAHVHIADNTNLHYLAFNKMIQELHVMIWSETLPFECSEFIHYNNLIWIYDPLRKEEERKRTVIQSMEKYKDLELLKFLNPEFFSKEIDMEKSFVCFRKSGQLLASFIVRRRNLCEFFGSEFPEENHDDDVLSVRDIIEKHFKNKQYEGWLYISEDISVSYDSDFCVYLNELLTLVENHNIFIWLTNENLRNSDKCNFFHLNDKVWISVPYID